MDDFIKKEDEEASKHKEVIPVIHPVRLAQGHAGRPILGYPPGKLTQGHRRAKMLKDFLIRMDNLLDKDKLATLPHKETMKNECRKNRVLPLRMERYNHRSNNNTQPTVITSIASYASNHETPEESTCSLCGQKFTEAWMLVIHERNHTGIKPYKCSTCHQAFGTESVLTIHEQAHKDDHDFPNSSTSFKMEPEEVVLAPVEPPFHTERSPTDGDNVTVLAQERFLQNNKYVEDDMVCRYCQKLFPTKRCRNLHEVSFCWRRGEGDKVCSVCGKRYRTVQSLVIHEERIHSRIGEKSHKCSTCHKAFGTKTGLSMHKRSHLNEDEFPFKCKYCGKGFSKKFYIAIHERIHSGETPFTCQICGEGFRSRDYLYAHRKSQHGNNLSHDATPLISGSDGQSASAGSQCTSSSESLIDLESIPSIKLESDSESESEELVLTASGLAETEPTLQFGIPVPEESEQILADSLGNPVDNNPSGEGDEKLFDLPKGSSEINEHNAMDTNNIEPGLEELGVKLEPLPTTTVSLELGSGVSESDQFQFIQVEQVEILLEPKPEEATVEEEEVIILPDTNLQSTTIKRFHPCPYCNKEFSCNSKLVRHKRIHDGPFECKTCGKRFRDKPILIEHVFNHSSHPRLKCQYCEKEIKTKFRLEIHERIHTNEKPFVCDDCGIGFRCQEYLKCHWKKVHRNKSETSKEMPEDSVLTAESSAVGCEEDYGVCRYCQKLKNNIHIHESTYCLKRDRVKVVDGVGGEVKLEYSKSIYCKYCKKEFACARSRRCHEAQVCPKR